MKNIKKIQESAVHGDLLDISTITHSDNLLIIIAKINIINTFDLSIFLKVV